MAKKHNAKYYRNLFFILIGIIFIIFTLGIFAENWTSQTDLEKAKKDDNKIDELEKKNNRLIQVENKINHLELKQEQLKKTEKKVFFKTRISISIVLLIFNICYYLYLYGWSFKLKNLNSLLNFNEAFLLGYAFFAFITYGTPSLLIKNLKLRASQYLKKNHIEIYTEYEQLLKERKHLIAEIEVIKEHRKKESLAIISNEIKKEDFIKYSEEN